MLEQSITPTRLLTQLAQLTATCQEESHCQWSRRLYRYHVVQFLLLVAHLLVAHHCLFGVPLFRHPWHRRLAVHLFRVLWSGGQVLQMVLV